MIRRQTGCWCCRFREMFLLSTLSSLLRIDITNRAQNSCDDVVLTSCVLAVQPGLISSAGCDDCCPPVTESTVDLLHSFSSCSGMDLIFGLNALLRTADNTWNSSNARSLLQYCESKQYRMSWELGNGTWLSVCIYIHINLEKTTHLSKLMLPTNEHQLSWSAGRLNRFCNEVEY